MYIYDVHLGAISDKHKQFYISKIMAECKSVLKYYGDVMFTKIIH